MSYDNCTEVTAQCPIAATTYGYAPNLVGNSIFVALFGLLLGSGLVLGIRARTWTYTFALSAGTFLETIGYIGHILMHNTMGSRQFLTADSPSFIAASIYLTLKHLVLYFGPKYSLIQPKLYPRIFVGCDIVSIVIQAAGGGIAGAAGKSNISLLNVGNNMMIAGIAFQIVTMTFCGVFALMFFLRYRRSKNGGVGGETSPESKNEGETSDERKRKRDLIIFCVSIMFSYTTILIRCIYRLPEMAGGWGNPLMQNEKEFLVLDGMMVAIASFALTVIHPAFFFTRMCKTQKAIVQE